MKSTWRVAVFSIACLLLVDVVHAGGISIDASKAPYNTLSNVEGTSIYSDDTIQTAGATQIAAEYRLENGLDSLPAGSSFQVTWSDGSSETIIVDSTTSSLGAVPVPGTQHAPPPKPGSGGGSGAGGGISGGGDNSGMGGDDGGDSGSGGTVTVGDPVPN